MTSKNPIEKACEVLGSAINLANKLEVHPSMITSWSQQRRPVPIKRCVEIEKLTNGVVSRKDLRPDDWHEIWPELTLRE